MLKSHIGYNVIKGMLYRVRTFKRHIDNAIKGYYIG